MAWGWWLVSHEVVRHDNHNILCDAWEEKTWLRVFFWCNDFYFLIRSCHMTIRNRDTWLWKRYFVFLGLWFYLFHDLVVLLPTFFCFSFISWWGCMAYITIISWHMTLENVTLLFLMPWFLFNLWVPTIINKNKKWFNSRITRLITDHGVQIKNNVTCHNFWSSCYTALTFLIRRHRVIKKSLHQKSQNVKWRFPMSRVTVWSPYHTTSVPHSWCHVIHILHDISKF